MVDYGTGMGVQLYGWDSVSGAWVKILVNAAGKLIIDPSEIFEDTPTDGEAGKAATSNWSHDHDADPDAHHVAFVAADHTAIGNAAPHHAEAHTLASHTTKAHAELTGVGSSDHHVKYTDAEAVAAVVTAGALFSYTELDPVLKTVAAGAAGWIDWDLSASIPAGAKYAEINLTANANTLVGVRKNGSAVVRSQATYSAYSWLKMTVALDAGRVCEIYRHATSINYGLCVGYWS